MLAGTVSEKAEATPGERGELPSHLRQPKGGPAMKLSTRNQLAGKVTAVKLGTIMSEITVDVGGQTITAAITSASAEELELTAGDNVTVLIKATEVMLGK
jgi:molybdopterin-binding protein